MGEIVARFYGTSDHPLEKMEMDESSIVRMHQSLCLSPQSICLIVLDTD